LIAPSELFEGKNFNIRAIMIFSLLIGVVGLGFFWAKQNQLLETLKPTALVDESVAVDTLTLQGSNTAGESFAPRLAAAFLRAQGATIIETIEGDSIVEKTLEARIPQNNQHIWGDKTE
jgi:Mn2+/Fe2+ NRAMP family transporter